MLATLLALQEAANLPYQEPTQSEAYLDAVSAADLLYQKDLEIQSDEYLAAVESANFLYQKGDDPQDAAKAAQDIVLVIQAENEAIYRRPLLESATLCCAVTYAPVFTANDVEFTISQPQIVGEAIRVEVAATIDGVPVATDNEYLWYGLTEICTDWNLDWQQALREAVAAVVLR